MHKVDEGGTAICEAPSRIACGFLTLIQIRLVFSISTVASSTSMPTARRPAKRHDIDRFS
jgi:hypothetical protein